MAVIKGFGAVFVDADKSENTSIEYYDVNDKSLGKYEVPVLNNGHVFLGVLFDQPLVRRVRIVLGNSLLGPEDSSSADVTVMDDLIYGEPVHVE